MPAGAGVLESLAVPPGAAACEGCGLQIKVLVATTHGTPVARSRAAVRRACRRCMQTPKQAVPLPVI
jgi:hypothetical protein